MERMGAQRDVLGFRACKVWAQNLMVVSLNAGVPNIDPEY